MAAPRRRRRDASLGQIPLSSGEIELYSRQDEAARRRHRLLAVREQERRLAQQVTQRYRNNLRKLQRGKSQATHKTLSLEQQKLLTDLHVRYQNSLQSMGAAQRNARLKLLELMEQAQEEQEKWTYNSQITAKQRTIEAEEAQEQEEGARTARYRQVEQNMERLRALSAQQRRQASARARREHEVALQRAKDRKELEKLRRMQSPEEVFVTPRPHEKDVRSYQFSRTHCVAPSMSTVEKPVTVIRHNRKHPTTMRGEEEAKKYNEEMDRKRERKRVIMEEQQEMAAERGKSALDDVTSKHKAQQAFEWLALVDKMERHARGQQRTDGDDFLVDTREVDREIDDPEQMVERAFARMLGLDEDSVELSSFLIETDDDHSVGLADTDHENSDHVKAAERDMKCRIKHKADKYRDSLGSLDGAEFRLRRTKSKDYEAEVIPEKPLKTTAFGDLQREELEKLKQAKSVHEKSVASNMSFKSRGGEYEVGISGKHLSGDDTRYDGNEMANGRHLEWGRDSLGPNRPTTADMDRRRYTGDEERPEGTDSEEEELGNASPSGIAARDEYRNISPVDHRTVAHDEGSLQSGHLLGSRHDSSVAASGESEGRYDKKHIRSGDSSPIDPGGQSDARLRNGSAGDALEYTDQQGIVGDNRLGSSSSASFRSSYRPGHYQEENDYGKAAGDERDSSPIEVRNRDAVASQNKKDSTVHGWNGSNEKSSPDSRDHAGHLPKLSVQERDQDRLGSRQFSDTRRAQEFIHEREEHLPSSSSVPGDEPFYEEKSDLDCKNSRVVSIDEDERSVSESSFAPSQKSLSRLDEVVDARAKSLEQRFIDQHMLSFSSSVESSEDEGEPKTEVHHPSIGNDTVHASVNINPDGPYRRQIDLRPRRSSTSAASITQYSLPPSDTHSSFDDSLDRLHPEYGDDSFVNELVPMFPKRALPPPQQSLDGDSQALEEYDVQLDAPNMSRMLTPEQRASFGRSRQRLVRHEPHHGSAEHPLHQSTSATTKRVENNTGSDHIEKRVFSSSSRRSSSGSSSSEVDAKHIDTSVEQISPQNPTTKHTPGPDTHQLIGNDQTRTADQLDIDDRSDMSSESGVSSLGFAVQLNLVAGTIRRSNIGDDRRDFTSHGDIQLRNRASVRVSDDDVANQSNTSERSFASSSSISMDTHFNYLANKTSAVGKSLPLYLRLPAMIYGKKDMTKPPTPMAWSAASVSSIASVSEADPNETSEAESHSAKRSVPRSNSSMSGSLVKGHSISLAREQYKMDQRTHGNDSQQLPPASQEISDSENTVRPDTNRAMRVTFDSIKEKVSQFPPPPLGSLNMSQPPPPVHNFHHRESQSSSSSSSELRATAKRQTPPPPVHSLNMSQPPPPMQSFARSLSSSQLSSEQDLDETQSSDKRDGRHLRHSTRQPYEIQEERKLGESGASSRSDSSFGGSFTSTRRRSMKTAEQIVIPVNKFRDNNDDDSDTGQGENEMTLAEAFKRRHPRFGRRVESHRDKLKRQRGKPQHQEQQQQRQSELNTALKREVSPSSLRDRSATDSLPPEKQELLNRLASGSRAKISSREMKERSRRMYHQLPEVVERKRQEEVMRRRRERLNELRKQEKERRLQQKQRRQQQQKR